MKSEWKWILYGLLVFVLVAAIALPFFGGWSFTARHALGFGMMQGGMMGRSGFGFSWLGLLARLAIPAIIIFLLAILFFSLLSRSPKEPAAPAAPAVPAVPPASASTPCPRCGKPVEAGWVACPYCGKNL
jgi:hypothetical protein